VFCPSAHSFAVSQKEGRRIPAAVRLPHTVLHYHLNLAGDGQRLLDTRPIGLGETAKHRCHCTLHRLKLTRHCCPADPTQKTPKTTLSTLARRALKPSFLKLTRLL
jgi:hypothetical protein